VAHVAVMAAALTGLVYAPVHALLGKVMPRPRPRAGEPTGITG
jgi:hypothetical protein